MRGKDYNVDYVRIVEELLCLFRNKKPDRADDIPKQR